MQLLWKIIWRFFKTLKIESPYDPTIPRLGTFPKKIKTLIWKDTCAPIFTATLFAAVKIWKEPKCPSTDEWIKKMLYIYMMEYYSSIKRNKTGSFVVTWAGAEALSYGASTRGGRVLAGAEAAAPRLASSIMFWKLFQHFPITDCSSWSSNDFVNI